MKLNTVFEQFATAIIKEFNYYGIDMSITNISATMLLTTVFVIGCFSFVSKFFSIIPNNWQLMLEAIYVFVFGIVAEQAGKKGYKFFPHFFNIFVLIFCFNIIGLLPFGFTVTSHISVTLTIALSYFFAWIIIGVTGLRKEFIYLFYPKNMPGWLIPLLTVIETISFFLRPFSLGIRLFANMLAGHILLHILADALVFMTSKVSVLLTIPFIIILCAIGLLELGIGMLQAYIFTILLAIYLKDSLISHNHNNNNTKEP